MTKVFDKSILYWQGRGRNPLELINFNKTLKHHGFSTQIMPLDYDIGLMPNNPESRIYQWIHCQIKTTQDWWIGLSLGASVAYILASSAMTGSIPQRITLINPFANREKLAKEKNFSLNQQWVINPINHRLCVPIVDIVLSVNDNRIPIKHGQALLPMITAKELRVIMLDADHTISDSTAQLDLANVLLRDWKKGTVYGQHGKIISCDFC